ncbi:MAG: 30S ribosomal protein S2 [Candidatus Pacebacteria bacterium]|nr:30S ribosomal protein S2 [Candidatus Paceibacterota bacterium]MDD5356606.1 30S ribosomal protein S2 [Candidatus Paceibacterota bacterium]
MTDTKNSAVIEGLFKAGAHFAYSKSRRHPSVKSYIFGAKNKVEIFDLEKTSDLLEKAKMFVKTLGAEGKQILFVGGKPESRDTMKNGALAINMPYVAGRWIGGTLTNFGQIRSRIDKMLTLMDQREKGELSKYTKKERLLIDREITKLNLFFSGLVLLKGMPQAVFVIDSRKEKIAVDEAKKMNIPVIALLGSDCDISEVDHAIVGNDASLASIRFFVDQIVKAYQEGKGSVERKA